MTSDQEVQEVAKEKRKHRDSSPEEYKKKSRKSPEKENNESDQERRRRKRKHRSRSRSRSRSHSRERRERRQRDREDSDVKYRRYYGEDDDKQSKQNSDRYWTKYPKKDDNRVGARYYEPVPEKDDREADEKKEKEKRDAPKVDDDREGDEKIIPARQRKTVDLLTSRTGGAYIPPAKLRMMQAEITDKNSPAYQRIAWEALKKSIHGYINKVNTSNIGIIARELLHENIVRGRGLLCKSIIQAQAASPTFTNVYAALVAVINSKFPNIGELLLKRLVLQFKRGFKQNNKTVCISAAAFIAHLVNQRVAHEILALEILTLLVESPTDDSVEVAISFLKECGQKLTEVSSKGLLNFIFLSKRFTFY